MYVVIGEPKIAEFVDVLLSDLVGFHSHLAREPNHRRVSRIQRHQRPGRLVRSLSWAILVRKSAGAVDGVEGLA